MTDACGFWTDPGLLKRQQMLLTCQPPSHAIFGIVFIFHVYSVPVCALVLGCVLYHSYVLYMLRLAMLFFFFGFTIFP